MFIHVTKLVILRVMYLIILSAMYFAANGIAVAASK
jgi:hypothetical protein